MSLSEFIRHHHREIIDRFEAFARTLGPVTAHMSAVQLRDHAEELLTAIVADMDTEQSREEQTRKSEGVGTTHAMQASGRLHADARIGHRFTAEQVLAEFRALRANVLRLYDDLGAVRTFQAFDASTKRLTRRSPRRLCGLPRVWTSTGISSLAF